MPVPHAFHLDVDDIDKARDDAQLATLVHSRPLSLSLSLSLSLFFSFPPCSLDLPLFRTEKKRPNVTQQEQMRGREVNRGSRLTAGGARVGTQSRTRTPGFEAATLQASMLRHKAGSGPHCVRRLRLRKMSGVVGRDRKNSKKRVVFFQSAILRSIPHEISCSSPIHKDAQYGV